MRAIADRCYRIARALVEAADPYERPTSAVLLAGLGMVFVRLAFWLRGWKP